ncbi:rodlin [Streptomyces gamaensis]|uniref:Rodlin n=1 Tax=Streptomyces gamaensis TaxID=1763542 RepID=A0ABW0Z6M5_9ACTN
MLKKACATTALTASALGCVVAPAAAAGDSRTVSNANGATTSYGNTISGGHGSPPMNLVGDTLNRLCLGVGKLGVQSLLLLINVGVQDVPVLTSQQQQQCTENSTTGDGDDPVSHLADQIPVAAGNGAGNEG